MNDIVIKKIEKKKKCICKQTSFNYNGKENALIGKKGNFDVESICVIRTLNISEDLKQLEEWTSLKCSDIIFDSNFYNWSYNSSVLNERIIGKKQLIFIIEDEYGEIFGYYFNTYIVEEYYEWNETDNKTFHFNLQSKYNRLDKPMKFEIKNLKEGGICLSEQSDDWLIRLGDINLRKENKKNRSFCYQNKDKFNYHGIENALCGKSAKKFFGESFTPKRILVIQMK